LPLLLLLLLLPPPPPPPPPPLLLIRLRVIDGILCTDQGLALDRMICVRELATVLPVGS
jgi:hypothetical protein